MIGICKKKLDFSTVLTVADQVMLYPTKWAPRAADMGIDIPTKKMQKKARWVSARHTTGARRLTNPFDLIYRHF